MNIHLPILARDFQRTVYQSSNYGKQKSSNQILFNSSWIDVSFEFGSMTMILVWRGHIES